MTVEIKTYIRGLDCSSDPVEDDDDSQSQASQQRRPLETVTVRPSTVKAHG